MHLQATMFFGLGFEINPAAFYLGAFVGDIRKLYLLTAPLPPIIRLHLNINQGIIKAGIKDPQKCPILSYASAFDDENSLIYFNPKYNITEKVRRLG